MIQNQKSKTLKNLMNMKMRRLQMSNIILKSKMLNRRMKLKKDRLLSMLTTIQIVTKRPN